MFRNYQKMRWLTWCLAFVVIFGQLLTTGVESIPSAKAGDPPTPNPPNTLNIPAGTDTWTISLDPGSGGRAPYEYVTTTAPVTTASGNQTLTLKWKQNPGKATYSKFDMEFKKMTNSGSMLLSLTEASIDGVAVPSLDAEMKNLSIVVSDQYPGSGTKYSYGSPTVEDLAGPLKVWDIFMQTNVTNINGDNSCSMAHVNGSPSTADQNSNLEYFAEDIGVQWAFTAWWSGVNGGYTSANWIPCGFSYNLYTQYKNGWSQEGAQPWWAILSQAPDYNPVIADPLQNYLFKKSKDLKANPANSQALILHDGRTIQPADVASCSSFVIKPDSQNAWAFLNDIQTFLDKIKSIADAQGVSAPNGKYDNVDIKKNRDPDDDVQMYRRFYSRNDGVYPDTPYVDGARLQMQQQAVIDAIQAGMTNIKPIQNLSKTITDSVPATVSAGVLALPVATMAGAATAATAMGAMSQLAYGWALALPEGTALMTALNGSSWALNAAAGATSQFGSIVGAAVFNPFTIIAMVIAAGMLIGSAVDQAHAVTNYIKVQIDLLLATYYTYMNVGFKNCVLEKNPTAAATAGITSEYISAANKSVAYLAAAALTGLNNLNDALADEVDGFGCPAGKVLWLIPTMESALCNITKAFHDFIFSLCQDAFDAFSNMSGFMQGKITHGP